MVIDKDFHTFISGNNQCLFNILEAMEDGIVLTDASGIIRFVNSTYLRITSQKEQDVLNRSLAESRPGSILPNVLKTGVSKVGVYRRMGDAEWVVDAIPILAQKIIVGGISIIKEVGRIKRISRELEKYTKQARDLKSVVSHIYQARYTFEDIIGSSLQIQKTVTLAKKIAAYEADLLITGETGTGKELYAQAIHNISSLAEKPFVAINCATLNPGLIESELFGYDDGAFTGAAKGGKMGLFFVADGGTLMLDEIAELPYEMQAKLLRVLQERRIRKVGQSTEQAVKFRIIAATNKDLLKLCHEGKFREDLYYRLNLMRLELPNLANRKEDLIPLAEAFLKEWNRKNNRNVTFHSSVSQALKAYSWPGNVRELRNVVEFAAYMCESSVITEIHYPKSTTMQKSGELNKVAQKGKSDNLKKIIRDTEQAVISSLLDEYGTNYSAKKEIAAQLGISVAALYNKIKMIP